MSSPRDALYRAILEDPDDDDVRRVFADYLDDTGESDYASFIRTQIELARVPEYDPFWIRHWFHDRDKITGQSFKHLLQDLPGMTWDLRPFWRGLPARIEVSDAAAFADNAAVWFAAAPLESLQLRAAYQTSPPDISALVSSPYLARMRSLSFCLSRLPAVEVQRLQDSPHTGRLRELEFEFAGIDRGAVATLLRPPLLAQLNRLTLRSNNLRWHTLVEAVENAGGPYRLRGLTVEDNALAAHNDWAARIFDAPLLGGLVELDLLGTQLGPLRVEELCSSTVAPGLQSLNLTKTKPGVPGVRAIAGCAALSGLRALALANNKLGPVAVKHLARSPHLGGLRVLNLNHNPIGDVGAVALAESPHLRSLVRLELMHCEIGDAGAEALLGSPVTNGLILLNVFGSFNKTQISQEVKSKLKERFGARVFV